MPTAADLWRLLRRASADRHHPWRVVALCTQGADGPRARSVILRQVHEEDRRLVFYTDRRSQKVEELAQCDRVALLCWDPRHQQQLRMTGQAVVAHDTDAVAAHWAAVPERSQLDYASPLPPGSPLSPGSPLQDGPSPQAGASVPGAATAPDPAGLVRARSHFAVLQVQVCEMDFLELDRQGHQRCRQVWLPAQAAWQGQPLVP
jgi:pyridoxamine 5'-phosphate oxidase